MTSIELDVFTNHFSELCDSLTDIDRLLPHLVAENVIKHEDLQEINAIVLSAKKVEKLLTHISGPLKAGNTEGFYIMLKIMGQRGHQATQKLAHQIRRSLPIMNFSDRNTNHHCNDQDKQINPTMFPHGSPIWVPLLAHQPPFGYYRGHYLPYNYSIHDPQQIAQHMKRNHTSMEELQDIDDDPLQMSVGPVMGDNVPYNFPAQHNVPQQITQRMCTKDTNMEKSKHSNDGQRQCKRTSSSEMDNSPRGSFSDSSTFRPHKKSSAFLLGSACSADKTVIQRRQLDKYSRTPLDGVLKDLCWMNIFMNDRDIRVYEVLLGNRHAKQSKEDILRAFKEFFSQQGIRRFVIYYSGPGSEGKSNSNINKGDWCFETSDEKEITYIGLKDILELWDEMRSQCDADLCELKDRYLLFIIADSCFSGSWVEEIKAKRLIKKTPSGKNYRDVHMIASCRSNETCHYSISYGGDFTRRYITADSSKHNSRDTATHLIKLTAQSLFQGVTFPLYMPLKGFANYYNSTSHLHTPVATNEKVQYRVLLMKYDGEILPIGRGLGIASGWSWMLSGQIFHN